jgi:hypothetical protein
MSLILDGTNGLSDVDGSASTPAIRGTDTNTGIFFPAADTIAFSEGGAEVARFDTSGNLIVGSTSATTGDRVVNTITYDGNNGYAGSRTATVWGDSTVRASAQADGGNGQLILGTESDHRTIFVTNNTERMRIDTSGNLLVGTSSNPLNCRLNVVGRDSPNPAAMGAQPFTNGSYALGVQNASGTNVGGIIANSSSTAYNTSSDYRLKEDIQPMTGALVTVQALKPVTYKWKVDGSDGQGFIAHELQEVCPDAVTGEKDAVETYTDEDGVEQTRPKYQGIDTSFLVATLTAAIQELKAELDGVKAELATLKA